MITPSKKLMLSISGSLMILLIYIYINTGITVVDDTDKSTVELLAKQIEEKKVLSLKKGWQFADSHIAPDKMLNLPLASIEMPSINKKTDKGTYAIRLKVPEKNRLYSFTFNSYANELSVWVNNELVEQRHGTRSTNPIIFYAKEKEIDLVIHSTSNTNNISVVETPTFGTMEIMRVLKNRDYAFSVFITSVFFVAGIYYSLVYLGRNRDSFFLNVALYFIFLSFATSLAGQKIALDLFLSLSEPLRLKLKVIFMLCASLPLLAIISGLKFWAISKRVYFYYGLFVSVVISIIIVLPAHIYLHYEDLFISIILIGLFAALVILFTSIFIKKNSSMELFLLFFAFVHYTIFLLFHIYKDLFGSDFEIDVWMFLHLVFLALFVAMRIRNAQKVIERMKYDAIQSKISFLTVQIKPHFIYNSIANIIALCYIEPKKAARLLGRFSTYLRLIFENNGPNMYAPLEKELMLIDAYVEMEQARFPEKIRFSVDVDSAIKHVRIPTLSVQPFVENAIRHGLFHKKEGGHVHLMIKQDEQSLQVTIEDDGIGITPEKLQSILQDQHEDAGIGIQNVMQRLAYMNNGQVTIESEVNQGTIVRIEFLIIEESTL